MTSRLFKRRGSASTSLARDEVEHWISASDLMSGLMMVFLFVSIALMRHAYEERNQMLDIAVAYEKTQVAIYKALMNEFGEDLPKWKAKINRETLSVEFTDMKIMFEIGSAALKPEFRQVLDDFFPRYMQCLTEFRPSISEIRIEGHASTHWNSQVSADEAYAKNMILSQKRTQSVLLHIQEIPNLQNEKVWMRQNIAAIGFSSSHAVRDESGRENAEASRRVTFRVLTNADQQILRILKNHAAAR